MGERHGVGRAGRTSRRRSAAFLIVRKSGETIIFTVVFLDDPDQFTAFG